MPSLLIDSKIERKAQRLLSHYRKPPIPVNSIAEKLGLEIEPVQLSDDISGLLVVSDDHGVIGVNKEHALVRRRFTVSHEIGHFVLHRQEEQLFIDKSYKAFFRDRKSASGSLRREREANAFAAALLMPSALIVKAAKAYEFELGEEDGPVTDLAELFQVSTQAMTFRLVNLGIFAPALVEMGA